MGINLSQSDNGVARLHQRSRVRHRDSLTDSVPKNVRGYVVVFIGDLKILKTFINFFENNMFVLHVNLITTSRVEFAVISAQLSSIMTATITQRHFLIKLNGPIFFSGLYSFSNFYITAISRFWIFLEGIQHF